MTKYDLLIAEFMGDEMKMTDNNKFGVFLFDNKWGCIMPVVDKITSLDLSEYSYEWEFNGKHYNNFQCVGFGIDANEVDVYIEYELDPFEFIHSEKVTPDVTKLQATYNCVVEFIKYYNKLK